MSQLPPELLALPPLALAAGIDLYLTLLFLGAAPTTPWWSHPLPGGLDYLDSPVIVIVVGALYLLEFSAERYPTPALLWNAFHAVIRPVAGALLALLLLSGQPLPLELAGALVGGVLASLAHAVRSGGAIVRWLGSVSSPDALLVSVFEDVVVLGLATAALDAPRTGTAIALLLVAAATPVVPSYVRAFTFAVRLVAGRAFQTLTQRRWLGADELPSWVRRSLEHDVFGGARQELTAFPAHRDSPPGGWSCEGLPPCFSSTAAAASGPSTSVLSSRSESSRPTSSDAWTCGSNRGGRYVSSSAWTVRARRASGPSSSSPDRVMRRWAQSARLLDVRRARKKTFDPGNMPL